MTRFTILGAAGAVGRALVAALSPRAEVAAIDRALLPGFLAGSDDAGHVIDCIGLTGDFRARPLDTAEAHVGIPARVLARGNFRSFLYLSSTRVYARAAWGGETAPLAVDPADPSDLYNLTKLAGEALCLSDPRPAVRVARLSNVVGAEPDPDTFLGQVLAEGRATGGVLFRQAPDSSKDYIALDAVAELLPAIAERGRHRLYNVASGAPTTHGAVARLLRDRFGWTAGFAPDAPSIRFPRVETARIREEFPSALSDCSPFMSTMRLEQEVPCSRSTRPKVA